jgi:hypothetical protein
MATASKNQIELFFIDLHKALENEFFLERTEKNKATITALEYTHQDIKNKIRGLTIEHYAEGPIPSKTTSNFLWVFGTEIDGKEIYIKIEIGKYSYSGEELRTAYIVSFHFAEWKMSYPYKK